MNKTKAAFCAQHFRLHPLNISNMPRHGRGLAKRSGNPLSSGLFGWYLSIQRNSVCMVRTGRLFLHNGHTRLNAKYKQCNSSTHSVETVSDLDASFTKQIYSGRHRPIRYQHVDKNMACEKTDLNFLPARPKLKKKPNPFYNDLRQHLKSLV